MARETDQPPAHTLVCMEIWGGNRAAERAVATPGLEIWVSSRPHAAAAAGGDVYYASLCGGGTITRFILADVAGHGAAAADVAKALRALMRANINRADPSELVRGLNRAFAALETAGRFATAVVGTYLTRGDRLTVCNAGHPRPLWRPAATGAWSVLATPVPATDGPAGTGPAGTGPADLPIGIVADAAYTRQEVTLGPGDLLLFYTDALTEAASPAGDLLGEAGLLGLVARTDPADPARLPAALSAALDDYRGGPAADDATFLVVRHTGGPARRPGLGESLGVYAKLLGLKSV